MLYKLSNYRTYVQLYLSPHRMMCFCYQCLADFMYVYIRMIRNIIIPEMRRLDTSICLTRLSSFLVLWTESVISKIVSAQNLIPMNTRAPITIAIIFNSSACAVDRFILHQAMVYQITEK